LDLLSGDQAIGGGSGALRTASPYHVMDYFALLNFPRTPWIEAAEAQARFLELSAGAHPDRVHNLGAAEVAGANEKFAELNKAFAVLRDHKERLHHLLALETGKTPATTQNIPNSVINLFARVGGTCRKVDEFLGARNGTTSPMLQAQMFAQGLDWSDRVAELQREVAAVKSGAEDELKQIAENWPAQKPIERLRELAHVFAMTARWEAQLQERFAALAAV
jgi:curved DNA-binding protein CbpA